jgi:uncharacterized protein YndB with AHSA1/START domain
MPQGESLRLTRVFAAPPARVFRAWTDAEQMRHWFCPYDHWTVEAECDPRVGGAYRVAMHDPDTGTDHVARGTYREVRPPERLVFTWQLQGQQPPFPETLVTVEFRDLGGRTEVTLTHEALPTPEYRERHAHGWNGCLDRLGKVL